MDWQCTPEQSSHQTPYEGQFLQKKKYTKLMGNMLTITPSHLLNNKRQNPTDQV